MDIIFNHDATPTWSGYVYQGEIAIYLVVKEICKLRDDGLTLEEIGSEYMIEVENCEDIAVIHTVNNRKEYLSIHQVKNEKNTNIEHYRSPLVQLMLEKGVYTKCNQGKPKAYLHVSNDICNSSEDILISKLNQWKNEIIKYYESLNELVNMLNDEKN